MPEPPKVISPGATHLDIRSNLGILNKHQLKIKSAIAFVAIALIVIVLAPQSKACVVECNPSDIGIEVCARNTGTNNCRHFPNLCRMNTFNCMHDKSYYEVKTRRCRNIPIGTTDVCRPL